MATWHKTRDSEWYMVERVNKTTQELAPKEERTRKEEDRTVVLKKTKMAFATVLLQPYIQYGAGFKAPLEP